MRNNNDWSSADSKKEMRRLKMWLTNRWLIILKYLLSVFWSSINENDVMEINWQVEIYFALIKSNKFKIRMSNIKKNDFKFRSRRYIMKLLCSRVHVWEVWEWTSYRNYYTFLWCVMMRVKAKWRNKSTSSICIWFSYSTRIQEISSWYNNDSSSTGSFWGVDGFCFKLQH